ncbi:MAG: tRNA (adenosine(37)-N6)-threonylcarbamoyltransferase complex dimerization subunit type 1 TsaB [Clostridiales bacterium]|nr:tRNA (adenosine(37)-N6)-threonylcarbamoyltransferase complex dimerization subunit type 1 TsaB [Clostridiales bacterium]
MNILALESSARAASVAVCRDAFLLAESCQNNGMTHSTTLLPMCESLLEQVGLTLHDIDLIACANGPGSFTGLRIGLSTAKGLAWPEEKPCVGVSTLEAMAWNVSAVPGVICCAMDARRSQVYNALFESDGRGGLTRLTEDRAISLEELFSSEKRKEISQFVVGDGAELCYNYGKERGFDLVLAPENLRHQRAWGVARAALRFLETGQPCSGAALEARYLRLSQAERERRERLNARQTP